MADSKNTREGADDRKLAADHGRKTHKTGGEPQKDRPVPRGLGGRTGSSNEK